MEIFSNFMDPGGGGEMLGRYVHFLAGITWIGMLYYFNFVQTPAFAEVSDATRSEAMRTITWRALWWFRFGALLTFLSGVWILGAQKLLGDRFDDFWTTPNGLSILIGALFATTMFLNVWLVIWPAQQIVIGSARKVAEGGEADPNGAGGGQARGAGLPGQHADVDPDAVVHGRSPATTRPATGRSTTARSSWCWCSS